MLTYTKLDLKSQGEKIQDGRHTIVFSYQRVSQSEGERDTGDTIKHAREISMIARKFKENPLEAAVELVFQKSQADILQYQVFAKSL